MRWLFPILIGAIMVLHVLQADQNVTLAWDPNPEPDVVGYIIHFGNESRVYPLKTNVGNITTATVLGLQEGLTYFFAVSATNTSGLESDYSNEVTNVVPMIEPPNSISIECIVQEADTVDGPWLDIGNQTYVFVPTGSKYYRAKLNAE